MEDMASIYKNTLQVVQELGKKCKDLDELLKLLQKLIDKA